MGFDFNDKSFSGSLGNGKTTTGDGFNWGEGSGSGFQFGKDPLGGGMGDHPSPSDPFAVHDPFQAPAVRQDTDVKRAKIRYDKPARRPRAAMPHASLPPKVIWTIVGIVLAVVLCVVFRDEIAAAVSQTVSLVITIVLLVVIFRLLLGGRRR